MHLRQISAVMIVSANKQAMSRVSVVSTYSAFGQLLECREILGRCERDCKYRDSCQIRIMHLVFRCGSLEPCTQDLICN